MTDALANLRDEYARTIQPARALAAEALNLENEVSNLVNEAYGLTPEEVALMWQTAPPRMPIPGPATHQREPIGLEASSPPE
jgi:diketogulonate reductase-like aldo/keto reductase